MNCKSCGPTSSFWRLGVPRLHVNKEQLNPLESVCSLSALLAPEGLRVMRGAEGRCTASRAVLTALKSPEHLVVVRGRSLGPDWVVLPSLRKRWVLDAAAPWKPSVRGT